VKVARPVLGMELGGKIEPLEQLAESSKIVDPNEFVTLNTALTVCADAAPLPQIASIDAVSIPSAILVVFFIVASFNDAVETFDPPSGECDELMSRAPEWRESRIDRTAEDAGAGIRRHKNCVAACLRATKCYAAIIEQ
jgi:hypothetical protein